MEHMLGGLPVKKNTAKKNFSIAALAALVLGCSITVAPLRAGAAQPSSEKREVWTASDAEIAREAAAGIPLKDIINNAVRSGQRIHEVVASAIKVGTNPSQVVYTAIAEGYATETVVKAALKAGATLISVVNSATFAGVDEKSTYIADGLDAITKTDIDPTLVVFTAITEGYSAQTVVRAVMKAGAPLKAVFWSATHVGPNDKSFYCGEIVTAAIKTGVDPSLVVHTAITEGYAAQLVVKAALKAGAPLDGVVRAATNAGADKKSIYVGAAEAGASPGDVERALSAAKTPGASRIVLSKTAASTLPSATSAPAPAIFGRGGILLSQAPAWAPPTLPLGPLKVNPYLGISETFSDNVFFTTENRKRGSITTITPGVRVELPFQAHSAELEYYSVITRYRKDYRIVDISDHHVNAAMDLKFTDRFGMHLSDQLARDHEPLSSSVTTGDLKVFDTNAATLSASYRTTDLTRMQIGYTKSNWRYQTDHFRDRDEDLISGTFFYQGFSRMSAFIEYGHRNFAYTVEEVDLDSKADTVQAGIAWDISPQSRGTLKAGVARKDFAASTRRDVTVYVWSADVRHDLTSDTTVVLTAQRSLNEPNMSSIDYFISTGVYADLTQRIVSDVAAVLRGAYVSDDYSSSQVDRTYFGGAGLTYKAKDWIKFAVDYNWHQRNSSILQKYVEHATIFTMNILL
jgi:hypothetical protein